MNKPKFALFAILCILFTATAVCGQNYQATQYLNTTIAILKCYSKILTAIIGFVIVLIVMIIIIYSLKKKKYSLERILDINNVGKAYKIANENWKFETENYWKRANYFWLFQAAICAGYFYSVTAENDEYFCQNPEIIVGITIFGFLAAFAWYLINIGSKQWQQIWVDYVYRLENNITGPLAKKAENEVTLSVTKTNEIVTLSFVTVWFLLGIKTVLTRFDCLPAFIAYIFIICLIIIIFYKYSKRSSK